MTEASFIKTVYLDAPPERVWEFLTDREKLGAWFFTATADLAEAADYTLMGKTEAGEPVRRCWGKVKRMDKPKEMVWDFTIDPLNGVMTTVSWTLEPIGAGTRLTLRHDGIPADGEAFKLVLGLDSGWDRHFGALREAIAQ